MILIQSLWQANKPLTAVGLAMIPLFFFSVLGIVLDARIIAGAPAWLKPSKFAISIAIYLLTLAWIYSHLTVWPQVTAVAAWLTALAMVAEIVIIDLQALRGTTSHFNNATPLDALLFQVMGLAIAVLWLSSVVITIALFRQPFVNAVLATALRWGMLMTVLGSASGALMVTPTRAQLQEAAITHVMPRTGAHTVGAPDGGPGLPGTGWSTQHGDLRVPHFLGLHAIQALALLAMFLIWRGLDQERGVHLVQFAAAGYFLLYLALLWQALQGRPFLPVAGSPSI